jgi:hypothetical protein
MQYPKEFVEKAKRIYPNWNRLHELLDNGSQFVGRMLYDSQSSGTVPLVMILNAKSLEELQEYARNEQEKSSLYVEWNLIYEQHRKDYNAKVLDAIEQAHKRGDVLS